MILEVDIGNTRIKWRVIEDGVVRDRGVDVHSAFDDWVNNIAQHYVLSLVRLACVGCHELRERLVEQCFLWGCEVQEARTTRLSGGVSCGYSDPSTMGVDRWLAVVAAYQRFQKGCVVVDAGSAVTVDLVDDQGRHLGGYIVPGFKMMQSALWSGTSKVRVSGVEVAAIAPGVTTDEAVSHGCLLMVKSMIDNAVKQLGDVGHQVPVVVTGGDADYLLTVLGKNAIKIPELVLDGLQPVISQVS